MMKPLVVRDAREPFEVMFLIACIISGWIGVATFPKATSPLLLTALGPLAWYWHLGLLVGAVIGLFSVFLKPPLSLTIERVGILLLAGMCGAYGAAILLHAPTGGVISGVLVTLAFGGSCAVRAWRITRDLHAIDRYATALEERNKNGGGR